LLINARAKICWPIKLQDHMFAQKELLSDVDQKPHAAV